MCFSRQDLETKNVVDELKPDVITTSTNKKKGAAAPDVLSLAWSADGQTLFAGYTDNIIRIWSVTSVCAFIPLHPRLLSPPLQA